MSDDIEEWALKEAVKRINEECENGGHPVTLTAVYPAHLSYPTVRALARLIAKHEQPPVDPLLVMAREATARRYEKKGMLGVARDCREGDCDTWGIVQGPLAALRMAQEQGWSPA